EGVGDAAGSFGKDVAVAAITFALHDRLDLRVHRDDLIGIETDPVFRGCLEKRIADATFPVDQRAVAVEGDVIDVCRHRDRGLWRGSDGSVKLWRTRPKHA